MPRSIQIGALWQLGLGIMRCSGFDVGESGGDQP